MPQLSDNEKKLLDLIKKSGENPLSYLQMADELGVSSTNTVSYYIKKLCALGYLRINPYNPRDYTVLMEPDAEIAYLPVYGLAQCGPQGIQNEDAVIDRIAISTRLFPYSSKEILLVRAKGDSMRPRIRSNDLVIVKRIDRAQVKEGDIVLASSDERGTFIKQLRIDKKKQLYLLISTNPTYPTFTMTEEELRIQGKVEGTLFNTL